MHGDFQISPICEIALNVLIVNVWLPKVGGREERNEGAEKGRSSLKPLDVTSVGKGAFNSRGRVTSMAASPLVYVWYEKQHQQPEHRAPVYEVRSFLPTVAPTMQSLYKLLQEQEHSYLPQSWGGEWIAIAKLTVKND